MSSKKRNQHINNCRIRIYRRTWPFVSHCTRFLFSLKFYITGDAHFLYPSIYFGWIYEHSEGATNTIYMFIVSSTDKENQWRLILTLTLSRTWCAYSFLLDLVINHNNSLLQSIWEGLRWKLLLFSTQICVDQNQSYLMRRLDLPD
jgi:hypothetical protein